MQRRQATRTLQSIEPLVPLLCWWACGAHLHSVRRCVILFVLQADPLWHARWSFSQHVDCQMSELLAPLLAHPRSALSRESVSVLTNPFAAMHRGCCLIRATELIGQEATEEVAALAKRHARCVYILSCRCDMRHTRGGRDTTQTQIDMQPLLTRPS